MNGSIQPRVHHLRDPLMCLALGFGSGLAPRAPGTAGTVVGVVLYLLLVPLGDVVHMLAALAAILAGIPICGIAAQRLGVHDHPAIVWDEIAGFLIVMLMAPAGWYWVVAGFALFRLFDVWKPWPISWLDRHVDGGLGIMLDDVLAGVYALVVLQLLHWLVAAAM